MYLDQSTRSHVFVVKVAWLMALIIVFGMPVLAGDNGAPRNASGTGHPNELLITDLDDAGRISIFEFRDGSYFPAWSALTPGLFYTYSGGEAGDLTGDGVLEIAIRRTFDTNANQLQIWTFNPVTSSWYELWSRDGLFYVGDILDVDNDGVNELLVTNRSLNRLEIYSHNGIDFELETILRSCGSLQARYIATAGDLNGNGTPEILFQCQNPEDVIIQEHLDGEYPVVGSVPAPVHSVGGIVMQIDDMETGDVNGDGLVDAVFCGSTGSVHVLTYDSVLEMYNVDFSSPPPFNPAAYAATCSVGDITNDGHADILVVNAEGPEVYSNDGVGDFYMVWSGPPLSTNPAIGGSSVGDSDNDGFSEFFYGGGLGDTWWMYENDVEGASTFFRTSTIPLLGPYGTFIIADLNPFNIFASSVENGDTSSWSAVGP